MLKDSLQRGAYRLLQGTLAPILTQWGCSVRVRGLHHIPERGPGVLICNHPSFLDPYLISAVSPRQIHWVAAAFLSSLPVLGGVSRSLGILPLIRAAEGRSGFLIDKMGHALRSGQLVGIFPEGMDWMRGTSSSMSPVNFHETFVRGILQAHLPFLPIIPVAVFPLHTRWHRTFPAQAFKILDPQEPAFQSGTLDVVVYRDVVISVGQPTTWDAFYAEFQRCIARCDHQAETSLVHKLTLQSRAKVEALLVRSQNLLAHGSDTESFTTPLYPNPIARRLRWPPRRP